MEDLGRGRIVSLLSTVMGRQRLTMTELAVRTGLGRDSISDIYHDKTRRIDFATLAALCFALETTPGELFGYQAPAPRRRTPGTESGGAADWGGSGAKGLPICARTAAGVRVWAQRSASANRGASVSRWWLWVTARRRARQSHSIRSLSGS